MSTRGSVPDAWDDDWVSKADSSGPVAGTSQGATKKVSQAERRAKQAELNRQLWEEAEAPKNTYFIDTRNEVPLKSDFKPAMKVLSRKPAPKVVARTDPSSGLEQLTLEEDEDDESDTKKGTLTMEERQQKAQREREEKQKKYEEVRERLFGGSDKASGTSSPGTRTPPVAVVAADARTQNRAKVERDSRPSSAAGSKTRQLYDPNHTAKPDSVHIQKKETHVSESGRSTPAEEPIRSPRGPDGSGRGGFGFSPRGGRVT